MTLFFRVLDAPVSEKASALREAVGGGARSFDVDPEIFTKIAGSPFAYWINRGALESFSRYPAFEQDGRVARVTNPLGDNLRFARLTWEIDKAPRTIPEERIVPKLLCKGGAFSRFYYDPHLLVYWDTERCSYFGFVGTEHRPLVRPASANYFFRPGLTWPIRTSGLSIRVMPSDCIFGSKGPAAFTNSDDPQEILALCALMNSSIFSYLVGVQLARTELAQSYEVGLIQQTPVPSMTAGDQEALSNLASRAWLLKRATDVSNETSHAFLLPTPILRRIPDAVPADTQTQLMSVQAEIDDRAFRLYGLEGVDRASIEAWGKGTPAAETFHTETDVSEDEDKEEDEIVETGDQDALLSWTVGVVFGRFDIRLATGERELPAPPRPFDALLSKSPGMLPEGEIPFQKCDGILVDDAGHADDLIARIGSVYTRIGFTAPESDSLRRSVAQEFFARHIKMYSRSRRKAPIYWQMATSSASYSVWLYIHSFTKDTLFRVQSDFVAQKLAHEQRRLEELRTEAQRDQSAAQRRAVEAQEAFVNEVQTLHEDVKRVVPLWNPNLDDGVIIMFAPLWRLIPQHRAWQKELRNTWNSLCRGDHDWASLAMYLWPERVVPKCATDRSLAIAHGLEDNFWFEGDGGKWEAREKPKKSADALVRERTSSAVKAALKSLLEAPDAGAGTKRTRKSRAA